MTIPARDEAVAPARVVDPRQAAAILGISEATFADWVRRSKTTRAGIAAKMPNPVKTASGIGYRIEEIEEFGRQIALKERGERTAERSAGRYFTPHAAADFMAEWAIRSPSEVIVEPSLGEGQFADAARRIATARGWPALELHACELDPTTANAAVARGAIDRRYLHVGDFLKQNDLPSADVVIGNPPYVRMRELAAPLREAAHRAAAVAMGHEMDPAGSVWMPFVAKATALLRPTGRLALVLPLDFTYVRYARPLWRFLADSFGSLTVLRFRERVFPDIMQNVLILLAENRGGRTQTIHHIAAESLSDLGEWPVSAGYAGLSPAAAPIAGAPIAGAPVAEVPVAGIIDGERLFQHALLPGAARDVLEVLERDSAPALERVKFSVGYVSGNKKFFHPTPEVIARYKLPQHSLLPTLESSRQLTRGGLGTATLETTAFLWSPGDSLSEGEQEYVAVGEANGVDMAYKCRVRTPWYRVPGVRSPDLVLTAFSDRPRLYLNDADWTASNSVLGGRVTSGEPPLGIVSSWYSPLTLLSTELNIHSLGGGVMIAVPREADAVRILRPEATAALDVHKLDQALRSGDADAAYDLGAKAVRKLVGASGLAALREATEKLTRWRKARP